MRTEPEPKQSKSWVTGGDKNEGAPKFTEEEVDPLQTQQSNAETAEREGEVKRCVTKNWWTMMKILLLWRK
jgi:hypothetical protein